MNEIEERLQLLVKFSLIMLIMFIPLFYMDYCFKQRLQRIELMIQLQKEKLEKVELQIKILQLQLRINQLNQDLD